MLNNQRQNDRRSILRPNTELEHLEEKWFLQHLNYAVFGDEAGYKMMSAAEIAEIVGIPVRTVYRILHKCYKLHLIERIRGEAGTRLWVIEN